MASIIHGKKAAQMFAAWFPNKLTYTTENFKPNFYVFPYQNLRQIGPGFHEHMLVHPNKQTNRLLLYI